MGGKSLRELAIPGPNAKYHFQVKSFLFLPAIFFIEIHIFLI